MHTSRAVSTELEEGELIALVRWVMALLYCDNANGLLWCSCSLRIDASIFCALVLVIVLPQGVLLAWKFLRSLKAPTETIA